MSDSRSRPTLEYATGRYKRDVLIERNADGFIVTFPTSRPNWLPAAAVVAGILAAFLMLGAALLCMWFDIELVLLVPVIGLGAIVVGITGFVLLQQTARHDVLRVTRDGVRFEQWCHVLEQERFLLWSEISAFGFGVRASIDPSLRVLFFESAHGDLAIEMGFKSHREEEIAALLDRFRQHRD